MLMEVAHDFDIIKVSVQTAVETGISSVFFPHGLGHLLGAQVHDVGGLQENEHGGHIPRPQGHPYLRLTRILRAGIVLTIEPGFYFIDSLLERAQKSNHANSIGWKQVDFFRTYGGVRIEDNILCTENDPENLKLV